ncbi:MAG: hypothetical protein RIK87_09760 [Fuerstiella sp.]
MIRRAAILILILFSVIPAASAQEIVDSWKYTVRRPAERWQLADFDTNGWSDGDGGFSVRGTPGARVGTVWATNSIWLRKLFELSEIPGKPALLIQHDEDVEVFVNGKPVAKLTGFTTKYEVVPIADADASTIRVGSNLMAVHCRQKTGGQFIDVHLIDADDVPALPKPKRSTMPSGHTRGFAPLAG